MSSEARGLHIHNFLFAAGGALSRPVIITGGTGFIGKWVTAALERRGHRTVPMSRSAGFDGQRLDITDRNSVLRAFGRHPDAIAIVHLSGLAHARRGIRPEDYHAVNTQGTANAVFAAEQLGISRFIHFSTASIYGELRHERILTEDLDPLPIGDYAVSKARGENYALSSTDPVVLRPPAVYASDWLVDVRKRAYLPGFAGRILLRIGEPLPAYSFCWAGNAAEAVVMAVEHKLPSGVYNVADDRPYTQQEVALAVQQMENVRRSVTIPRFLGIGAYTISGLVPGRRARSARVNLAKLFAGQVMDTRKIRAAGFRGDPVLPRLSAHQP